MKTNLSIDDSIEYFLVKELKRITGPDSGRLEIRTMSKTGHYIRQIEWISKKTIQVTTPLSSSHYE